ncbi:MAG: winged helix-turn-helix domain-containing protein [Nitriliruptorales bacterium]
MGPTDAAWCEVRLLGPTEVMRDGTRLDGITPRAVEVLAYLVTHRDDGVSKERLDDAVWSGRAARPGSQRVTAALTKLRDALGTDPTVSRSSLAGPERSGSACPSMWARTSTGRSPTSPLPAIYPPSPVSAS